MATSVILKFVIDDVVIVLLFSFLAIGYFCICSRSRTKEGLTAEGQTAYDDWIQKQTVIQRNEDAKLQKKRRDEDAEAMNTKNMDINRKKADLLGNKEFMSEDNQAIFAEYKNTREETLTKFLADRRVKRNTEDDAINENRKKQRDAKKQELGGTSVDDLYTKDAPKYDLDNISIVITTPPPLPVQAAISDTPTPREPPRNSDSGIQSQAGRKHPAQQLKEAKDLAERKAKEAAQQAAKEAKEEKDLAERKAKQAQQAAKEAKDLAERKAKEAAQQAANAIRNQGNKAANSVRRLFR